MTANPSTPARPRRRGLTAAALVTLAALTGACAKQADGPNAQTDGGKDPKFEATAQFLAAAVKQSKAKPYKFDFGFDISVAGESINADHLMSGQVDGKQSAVTMDMRQMFQSIPGASSIAGDLTLDMVTDQKTLYVKAPMIDTLNQAGGLTSGASFGPLEAFGGLNGGWGKVDLSTLGDDALGQVMGSTGAQGGDPGKFLDMVKNASSPHDLGSDTIDGVAVKGLGASSTFRDLIRSEGQDPDTYLKKLGTSNVPASMVGKILDLEVPMQVWFDGDNQVRRIKMDIDMNKLLDEVGAGEAGGASMSMTMNFSDYGDSSISIQAPPSATDVTAKFKNALPG